MNPTLYRVAFGALILLNVALGATAIQLAAGQVPIPEVWAWVVPILQAVIVAATTLLPRVGSEQIAAQVDALKDAGVPKHEMIVVPAGTVETALSDRPFSKAQVEQLTVSLLQHAGKG